MPAFTKGKWLIHEGYFDGITLNPKQYYIYPDCGEPYTDDFIVCAEEADARLVVEAPVMYDLLGKAWDALPDDHPLRYEIDAALCHVEGYPVPGEDEKDEED